MGVLRARAVLWCVAAASAPPLAVALAASSVAPGFSSHVTRVLIQSVMPDAFLYTAWALVVAAPIAGVAGRGRWRLLAPAAALFVISSAAVHVAVFGAGRDTLALVAMSHATLASAAVALIAFGAACGRVFRDALDAAAVAVAVVMLLAGGVLVAGAPVGDAPRPVIEAALTASPVVAVASAAGIDIARTELLYQMSPLARLHFDYPTWYVACAWYLLAAGALCVVMSSVSRPTEPSQC